MLRLDQLVQDARFGLVWKQERVASVGGDFWEITGARPLLGRLPPESRPRCSSPGRRCSKRRE
jgi:hypothetical protein